MASRVAVHRMKYEPISEENSGAAASTPSSLSEEDKAQLWQLNAFVQAEQKHLDESVDGVFHARKTEHTDANGKKVSRIDLYIRPKANGIFSFFDSLIYGKEQKLAANILIPLINRAGTAHPSVNSASAPKYQAPSHHPRAQQASVQVDAITSSLKAIADHIAAEKLETPGNDGPLVKQRGLQDAVRAQPEFSQWDARANALNDSALKKTLDGFGFKPEGIRTFERIATKIAQRRDTGDVDMAALHEFRMQWVATCERADRVGAKFREAVCENSKLRAWNVLAHHLDRQPQFDLRSYTNYSRVMVPHTTELIWPELAGDNGATNAMVKTLHTKATKQGISKFEQSPDGKHQLFAAKKIIFDQTATALSSADELYLKHKYQSFIDPSIALGEPFLLTPLFHYNEQTIQACVDIMLKPVEAALDKNQALPDIGIFSTDPRISTKFNEELDKLKMQAQDRRIRAAIHHTIPLALGSKVLDPVAIPTLAAPIAQRLKVQVGLSDDQWNPCEKTLLLLTSSSRECVRPEEPVIEIELSQMLESDKFSVAKEGSALFSETKQKSPWGAANRYLAPVEEVAVEESNWFFSSATLDQSKADKIRMAYTRVCKDAAAFDIRKLVLTPCFKEVSKTMLGSNKPYRDAVDVMVKTLAELSSLNPQLELTMVARSEAERELMLEAMENQRLAAS